MSLEIKKGVAKLYLKAKDLRIKALYVRFKEYFGRLKGVIECLQAFSQKALGFNCRDRGSAGVNKENNQGIIKSYGRYYKKGNSEN